MIGQSGRGDVRGLQPTSEGVPPTRSDRLWCGGVEIERGGGLGDNGKREG